MLLLLLRTRHVRFMIGAVVENVGHRSIVEGLHLHVLFLLRTAPVGRSIGLLFLRCTLAFLLLRLADDHNRVVYDRDRCPPRGRDERDLCLALVFEDCWIVRLIGRRSGGSVICGYTRFQMRDY